MTTTTTFPEYGLAGIETRYLGPTDTKGGRIKARRTDHKAGDHTVTLPYEQSLNTFDNHAAAARALCQYYKWTGKYFAASTHRGYVFARSAR